MQKKDLIYNSAMRYNFSNLNDFPLETLINYNYYKLFLGFKKIVL